MTIGDKFATTQPGDQTHTPNPVDQTGSEGFEDFPPGARDDLLDALTAVAEGGHPSVAKPLASLGSGVMELALRHQGDAFRVVYALRIDADIWVIHAFQKKSKSGIATPKQEIDLARERLKRLREALR